MKLTAIPVTLVSLALIGIVALAGGDAPGLTCTTGGIDAVLATIRTIESGGNYQAHAHGTSASGGYQFLDTTWNNYGGYPHAADAPPNVQDSKGSEHVAGILRAHDGDVTAVPVVWYIGHLPAPASPEWDTVPYPEGGNQLTPRQYQQHWLTVYKRLSANPPAPTRTSEYPATTATTTNTTNPIATTVVAPRAECRAELVDGYALPLDRAVIDAGPGILLLPHHDYPALDLPVPVGTPVYAVHAGTVTRVSDEPNNCYPDTTTCTDTCGLGITITDITGVDWIYCHASRLLAERDQPVDTGQQIMLSGNTGHSSGPHLHLGIRINGTNHCPQPLLTSLYQHARGIDPTTLPTAGCIYHA